MLKTLARANRIEHERFRVPHSAQDIVPVSRIWGDGLFLYNGKFSRTLRMSDINYQTASKADKKRMLEGYCDVINTVDCGMTAQITIINHPFDRRHFEQSLRMQESADGFDAYRTEFNSRLSANLAECNGIVQDKFLTLSVPKSRVEDARVYLKRAQSMLEPPFRKIGSSLGELDAAQRLKLLHDWYRQGEEEFFQFDLRASARLGHSFRDYIAPDAPEFHRDHFVMGRRYGRVLFLRDYAAALKDSFIAELSSLNRSLMLSIQMMTIPTDEAVRETQNRLLGVQKNITSWQQRQNANSNWSAIVPYDMDMQRAEVEEMLADLTQRDQRMLFGVVTIMLTASSLKELDADTDEVLAIARRHMCQFAVLFGQQLDGVQTTLPLGIRRIDATRTFTTESVAALTPFRAQEICHDGGIYLGQHVDTGNILMVDRAKLLNQGAWWLGVPGSGKSMGAKDELIQTLLRRPSDHFAICDPEGEYAPIAQALGGAVIRLAPGSGVFLNAMTMETGYAAGRNPLAEKSEFILSLTERLKDNETVSSREKSIIDRCVERAYSRFHNRVTLLDLRAELLRQKEPEAQELALAFELITDGSMDMFAHETNVDLDNRFLVFDLHELGEQMKGLAHLVVTDVIRNRVARNAARGIRTHLYFDEFHVLFEYAHGESFFASSWRQFRKRNAWINGITQNIEYLMDSTVARTMVSNSEYIIMYNQAASDSEKLAKLLNISDSELGYLTNVDPGQGLARIGGALIPFRNRIPRTSRLYRIMSTRPEDRPEGGALFE